MSVTCFLIHAAHRSRYHLRRYRSSELEQCPGYFGYHNARGPLLAETDDDPAQPDVRCSNPPQVPRGDARWPAKCDGCDYVFQEGDAWQVFGEALYRNAAGELLELRSAPAGAMWLSNWWPDRGPDGNCWTVRLPDGHDWMIDGPASNGGRWTRTGDAPRLTVRPSIQSPRYHGWLTDGVLVPC